MWMDVDSMWGNLSAADSSYSGLRTKPANLHFERETLS